MQIPKQLIYRFIFLAGFIACGNYMVAQPYIIKGRVVDATSGELLSSVNILINDSIKGISDNSGNFTVSSSVQVTSLKFILAGYQAAEIVPVLSGNEVIVILKKQEVIAQEEINTPELIEAQRLVDSIGRAENSNIIDKTNEAIIGGGPSLGMFNLDMNRVIHYNRYQGLYLGIGLHTNEKLSKLFSLGGYWGYGLASKSATYGADGSILLHRRSLTKLKLELAHDVSESGGMPDFGEVKRLFDPSGFHRLLVRRMDLMDLRQVTVSTEVVKFLRAGISYFQAVKSPTYEYAYVRSQNADVTVLGDQFRFSGLVLNFKYAYHEKKSGGSRSGILPAQSYPVVRMQVTRSFGDWLGSEYDYTRFDLQIEQSFSAGKFGRTSLSLHAGAASGDLPYCSLFDGRGGYGKFTIFAPQSFATMRLNEFVSDRYTSLFFMHEFGKLIKHTRLFNPELAVAAGAGFGNLTHPEKHRYIDIRSLTRGYYETGLLINNIVDLKVYNIGLGAFYRLGPYAFHVFGENIAFKFSLNFPL